MIDALEGYTRYYRSNKILVCREMATGYQLVLPISDLTGQVIANMVEQHIISVFSPPKVIFSDNATTMTRNKFMQK